MLGLYLKKIIASLVVPPLSFLTLAILFYVLCRKNRTWAKVGLGVSLALCFLFSTHWVSSRFLHTVQTDSVFRVEDLKDEKAIVILGGGLDRNTPEYQGHMLSNYTLQRVFYGAYLFDKTGLPILVSGGDPYRSGVSEGDVMKKVLEEHFLVPVTWVEDRSIDTYSNAEEVRKVLEAEGIRKIILVTHAWHMNRAQFLFEKRGFEVTPAGTDYSNPMPFVINSLLISGESYHRSYLAGREWVGRLWYWLRD